MSCLDDNKKQECSSDVRHHVGNSQWERKGSCQENMKVGSIKQK